MTTEKSRPSPFKVMEDRVAQALGLKAFSAQVMHSLWNSERSEFDQAHAEYLWSVRLAGHWKDIVTLAVGKFRTAQERETKLLAAVLLGIHCKPMGIVDISHMNDPVKTALQRMNLIATDRRAFGGDANDWPILNVSIATPGGYSYIKYHRGDMEDESWIRLRDVTIQMVSDVKPLYHRPELDELFALGIRDWPEMSRICRERGEYR